MKRLPLLVLVVVVCLPWPALAQSALKASAVRERIRLRVQPTEGSTPGKPQFEIVYVLDAETREFGPLEKDEQFAVKSTRGVAITLANFNPLTQSLTVSVDDVPDPSHETLGKLVDSMLSVSTILGAQGIDQRAGGKGLVGAFNFAGCEQEVADVSLHIGNLMRSFNDPQWSKTKIKGAIDDATKAINSGFGGGGALAVKDGVVKLDAFLGTDQDDENADTLRAKLKLATSALKVVETAAKNEEPTPCESSVQHLYMLVMIGNPGERLGTLAKVVTAFAAIVDYLRPYADPNRWSSANPSEFIARRTINPTPSTMKKVKVAYATRSYEESATPGVMTVKTSDAASAEFVLRRYSAWVPEIGVGITFNRVDRPTYGTGKDAAGQTTIAQSASDTSTKIDPTVLVNFVCGFCGFTPVTPMFQVGTSTSKTTPAFLLGGGIRFAATSKGDFAIGFGAILPWAKQLKDESDLGKVIDGTAALDEHLEWRRVKGFHSYLTLQYKF